jgi:hypothetical protein
MWVFFPIIAVNLFTSLGGTWFFIKQLAFDVNPNFSTIVELDKYVQQVYVLRNSDPLIWTEIIPKTHSTCKETFVHHSTSIPYE